MILSDNTTVVSYIIGRERPDPGRHLWWQRSCTSFLLRHKVVVRLLHVAGFLKTFANHLSRMGSSSSSMEWSLLPEVVTVIWEKSLRPSVDLFTSHLSYDDSCITVPPSSDLESGCHMHLVGRPGLFCTSDSTEPGGGEDCHLQLQDPTCGPHIGPSRLGLQRYNSSCMLLRGSCLCIPIF